jgi:hypothetical protein
MLSNCPGFGQLARLIEDAAVPGKPVTELLDDHHAWRRPVFTLSCDPDLVDLFHNGRRGYRAQYHAGIEKGEAANTKLLESLTSKLVDAWLAWKHRPYDEAWVRRSLDPFVAKIWIHQGHWSRGWDRRKIRIELQVDAWLLHKDSRNASVRKKVKLGALCPREDKLIVKGAFLNAHGVGQLPKPPSERAKQIHQYGFT